MPEVERLIDQVSRTLSRAGFDVSQIRSAGSTGLFLRRVDDTVIITWDPGDELAAPRQHAQDGGAAPRYDGLRHVLTQALHVILVEAGYTVESHPESGEVRVTLP
ncbi:hypothetical protein GCM10027168_66230 [Streptomyces capparidis]